MKDFNDITALVNKASATIAELEASRAAIVKQMKELEQAGMANASMFWAQDRFLYLSYPKSGPNEKRGKRKYVGNDKAKVREAIAKVERFKLHKTLAQQLELTDEALRAARTQMLNTDSTLSRALASLATTATTMNIAERVTAELVRCESQHHLQG